MVLRDGRKPLNPLRDDSPLHFQFYRGAEMDYLLIREICTHEDYPCCGCEPGEPYPMESAVARRLELEGRVKVLGAYRPPMYLDDDEVCDFDDDEED